MSYMLQIDFAQVIEAAKHVPEMFAVMAQRAAEAAKRIERAFAPLLKEIRAKRTYGLGNEDEAGLWQSDMCAGWLHLSCPTPARRYCDCTCHGGPVR